MRRRDFITLLGGSALAWPLAARAQQPAMPVVGVLRSTTPDEATNFMGPFSQGLREAGYVEGQNVTIDVRVADNLYGRLPTLAADLVRKEVAVIVATGAVNAALAAKAATTTIPIVFINGSDPIESGLVTSLSRPTGNVTGATLFGGVIIAKQIELLREFVPNANAIGFLVNPRNPNADPQTRELQQLARAAGFILHVVTASTEPDLQPAFVTFARLGVGGVLYSTDVFFTSQYSQLVALSARYKLPTIYRRRYPVAAGGLASYGARASDTYRVAGTYTGRILKGAKPSDLPVQLPTTFELFVNLKTANAIGITVPTSILLRADEVIE